MWGEVSCLRKQHDGRDWASNHQPSDLKSNALSTTPPCSHNDKIEGNDFNLKNIIFCLIKCCTIPSGS